MPCAGTSEANSCAVFERYADNEMQYLQSVRSGDTHDVEEGAILKTRLLDDPVALRERLHEDFVKAGFCVLAVQRQKKAAIPENVISISR